MADVIQIPFAAGIEEGADPKQLPPGTPVVLRNAVFDKRGRIRKRYGLTKLTQAIGNGASSISSGQRIIARANSLGIFDGTHYYVYDPIGNAGSSPSWQQIDRAPNLQVTWQSLVDSAAGVGYVDLAIHGNQLFVFYVSRTTSNTTAGAYLMVLDVATGAKVLPPTQVSTTAFNGRILYDGRSTPVVHMLYVDGGGNVCGRAYSPSTKTLGGEVVIAATAAASTSPIDAILDSGTGIILVYERTGTTPKLGVRRISASSYSTIVTSANFNGSVGQYTSFCLSAYNTDFVLAWGSYDTGVTQQICYVTLNGSTFAQGTTRVVASDSGYAAVAQFDSTHILLTYKLATAETNEEEPFYSLVVDPSTNTTSTGSTRRTYHTAFASKPWTVGGRWYVALTTFVHPTNYAVPLDFPEWTHFIAEITTSSDGGLNSPHRHVGTIQAGAAAPLEQLNNFPTLSQPAIDSSGNVYFSAGIFVNPIIQGFSAAYTAHVMQLLVRVATTGDDLARSVSDGTSTLVAAGAPYWTDGVGTKPAGFLHEPLILAASGNAGNSTYEYAAVYEYPDTDGRTHRSPPSPVFTASNAAAVASSNSRTIIIATSSCSGRQSSNTSYGANSSLPVRIQLYRSIANGSDLYEHSQIAINNPTVSNVSIIDTRTDLNIFGTSPSVTLDTRPQLYTAGELDDVAPPSFTTAIVHKGRVWGIGGDERTVWASKVGAEDPTIAPGWNEVLTEGFATRKTTLGGLDDDVLVLGPDSIHFISGPGPDANGEDLQWTVTAMQTDLGCVSPRSAATIPAGFVFQSARGIELLTRERQLVWIGESVRDTVDTYSIVTSAVVVAEQRQIRFTLLNASRTSGCGLVYDYGRNAWAQFNYPEPVIVDAALVAGTYCMLTSAGAIWQEDATTHLDGANWIQLSVTLPIVPNGPNSWKRVKSAQLLGTSLSNHSLTMDISRDFNASVEQTKTFDAGTDVTSIGPLEKAQLALKNQKMQAFSITISDSAPANTIANPVGNGAGPMLESLALYIQAKRGLPRTSAGRKG